MKRILITGASGFIGGFLVRAALERKYEVWAGVRKGSDLSGLADPRIHLIDLAYTDKEKLKKQFREQKENIGAWDYVIHNAGITKTNNKANFFRVNAGYTETLTEALQAADCSPSKFLLMSSLSSQGADTLYGASKQAAEETLRKQNAFPYVILRPTGVYGPGEKDYYLSIKAVQGGLNVLAGFSPQCITFIYVEDLSNVAFLALENEKSINCEYAVSDGDTYKDYEYTRLIQELLGKKHVLNLRVPLFVTWLACFFSEMVGRCLKRSMTLNTDKYKILRRRDWTCDTRSLREDLGFVARFPLRAGLEKTINWYRKAGWL